MLLYFHFFDISHLHSWTSTSYPDNQPKSVTTHTGYAISQMGLNDTTTFSGRRKRAAILQLKITDSGTYTCTATRLADGATGKKEIELLVPCGKQISCDYQNNYMCDKYFIICFICEILR